MHAMQINLLSLGEGEYCLSKDVDVSLWLDYRASVSEEPPLREAWDFVIINGKLHNEFDAFKKAEIPLWTNYVEINPLLEYYYSHQIKCDLRSIDMGRPTCSSLALTYMTFVSGSTNRERLSSSMDYQSFSSEVSIYMQFVRIYRQSV